MKPITMQTMNRSLLRLGRATHWPQKLDGAIRDKFGADTAPDTHYNPETNEYETRFTAGDDDLLAARVQEFIAGYMSALRNAL